MDHDRQACVYVFMRQCGTIVTQNLPEERRFIVPARTYTFIFKREDETLCWQHGRHDSGLFYSPLCTTLSLSLFLSLFLLSSLLARTAFILFSPFLRGREPPTCSLLREVIFVREKKKKNRDPDINVATTRFTRIYNAWGIQLWLYPK